MNIFSDWISFSEAVAFRPSSATISRVVISVSSNEIYAVFISAMMIR
jgi:hypothetical protein